MNMSYAQLCWRYLKLNISFWWGGLASAFIGLVLILIGLVIWQYEEGFQEHAVRTLAKVIGKNKGRETIGQTSEFVYHLACTIPDGNGGQREGKLRVTPEAWNKTTTGDEIWVEYDSTNPTVFRRYFTNAHADVGFLILEGLGGLFLAVGIPIAAVTLVQAWRPARRVRFGKPVLGSAGEVKENDSKLKLAGTYRLTYSFTDPNGVTRTGRGPAQQWSQASGWNPGDTILVLYDPSNPARHEADVFEARYDELVKLEE